MKNKFFFLMLIGIWINLPIFAQAPNPVKSWIGVRPMLYNPSFAGSTGSTRITGTGSYSNNYFADFQGKAKTLEFSYDNFIPRISSGIGLIVSYTNLNFEFNHLSALDLRNGYFKRSGLDASFVISPKISLKGKYTIAPSVEFTYASMDFASDFYKAFSFLSDSSIAKINYCAVRSGMMFNSPKLYLGYSLSLPIHFIDNSRMSVFRGGNHSIQAGYRFQKKPESKFSFTPQIVISLPSVWRNINNERWINASTTFRYKKIIAGLGVANSIAAMIGYQTEKLRITYSQNWVFGALYSGEFSLRLLIPRKNKIRKYNVSPNSGFASGKELIELNGK